MKKTLLYLFAALMLFVQLPSAQAGFVIKKIHAAEAASVPPTSTLVSEMSDEVAPAASQNEDRDTYQHRHKRRPSESGWEGIVAFVCSMCGIGILGVIFGAIGMGQGHKNRGLAIAGFVIGLVQIMVFALILTIVSMSYL